MNLDGERQLQPVTISTVKRTCTKTTKAMSTLWCLITPGVLTQPNQIEITPHLQE